MTHSTTGPTTGPTTLLVLQPELEDPPALLGGWLTESGCILDVRRVFAGEAVPTLDGYAGLLVLGGAMSANDDAVVSWIGPVKDLIRDAVAEGVPTLGVCLGHQLIASALGGRVAPNPLGQQAGLYDVGWTPAAGADRLFADLATPRRGVQWNDDLVLELPDDAVVLARTDRDEVQVVRYADRAWGVQLHPEVDAAIVSTWASASEKEALARRGIDADRLLRDIDTARDELDRAWHPLGAGFADVVHGR